MRALARKSINAATHFRSLRLVPVVGLLGLAIAFFAPTSRASDPAITQWASSASATSAYDWTYYGPSQAVGASSGQCNHISSWVSYWGGYNTLTVSFATPVYADKLEIFRGFNAYNPFIHAYNLVDESGIIRDTVVLSASSSCTNTYSFTKTTYRVAQVQIVTNANYYVGIDAVRLTGYDPDEVAPVLNLPGSLSAEATSSAGAAVSFNATATDARSGSVAIACSPASGATFGFGSTTVNCSASDSSGNVASASFAVTVSDTTAPAITTPTDVVVEALWANGQSVTYGMATAVDLVDGSVGVSCTPASGSVFALGAETVTCTATDAHGNTGSGSFSVSVVDTTPPEVTVPQNQSAEATGPGGAVVTFDAWAFDTVTVMPATSCVPDSGATFPVGGTTVTCSATDGSGNTDAESFTVMVGDTTPPQLHLPPELTLEATGPGGAFLDFNDSASDLVDLSFTATCSPAAGTQMPLGDFTVTCSATDGAGNQVTGSFIASVVDTTPPTVTAPGSVAVEAEGSLGSVVTFGTASASDIVDGEMEAPCEPGSGATFGVGVTTVICSVTDLAGNRGSDSFTVSVSDSVAPVFVVPDDFTVEATGSAGAMVDFADDVTATDPVSGDVPTICSPGSGTVFAIGATTVSCIAADEAGNIAEGTFVVTVSDTTGPALTLAGDRVVEAAGPDGSAVSFDVAPIDLVDGNLGYSCSPESGTTFAIGSTTVHCSAQDLTGNPATASFSVTVVDSTPPTITAPDTISTPATGPSGAVAIFVVTAADIVNGVTPVGCLPSSGSTFPIGDSTVTCTSTDAAGNSGSTTFLVSIIDTTPPVTTVPSSLLVEASEPSGAVVDFADQVFAADLVDASPSLWCVPTWSTMFAIGTTVVACHSIDDAGNPAAGASFTVTVVDSTAPVVTVPANMTIEATGPSGAIGSFTVIASDIVDRDPDSMCVPGAGATIALGTTTVTCSASDSAGNTGSASFTITVVDATAPAVTITSPLIDTALDLNVVVATEFRCTDVVGMASCRAAVRRPDGTRVELIRDDPLPTGQVGTHVFIVTGIDSTGNRTTIERSYSVLAVPESVTTTTSVNGATTTIVDGRVTTTSLPDESAPPAISPGTKTVQVVAPAGGTVTSDVEGDGISDIDFAEVWVTTPDGGEVVITRVDGTASDPGFSLVGQAFEITAPPATLENPIVLRLLVSLQAIPEGTSPSDLAIARNGTRVPACTGEPGVAAPDPCLVSTKVDASSVEFLILTSHASYWEVVLSPTRTAAWGRSLLWGAALLLALIGLGIGLSRTSRRPTSHRVGEAARS